jgi:hypothetical protein
MGKKKRKCQQSMWVLSSELPTSPRRRGGSRRTARDMAGTALLADFDWFEYRERAFRADPRA